MIGLYLYLLLMAFFVLLVFVVTYVACLRKPDEEGDYWCAAGIVLMTISSGVLIIIIFVERYEGLNLWVP